MTFVLNCTPVVRENYKIKTDREGIYTEIFNSDREIYGGSGVENKGDLKAGKEKRIFVRLPPLGGICIAEKE